jgi:uncharacterized protein (TIGR02145 family)
MKKIIVILIPFILTGLIFMQTSCKKDSSNDNGDGTTVSDADGNVYKTVTIGTQVWMAENLRVTHLNNGANIAPTPNGTAWSQLTNPGYSWYSNDSISYSGNYGAMYNWYAVNSGKLSPVGWHVPTLAEWETLVSYLGGSTEAFNKLEETGSTHWLTASSRTNSTGFTALPGGYRDYTIGQYVGMGNCCYYWTVTEYNTTMSNAGFLGNVANSNSYMKNFGFSVRCIKD